MATQFGSAPGSIYRSGNQLEVSQGAVLPPYCVKCGQPSEGEPIARVFQWHPQWVYVTVLVSPIIYLIIALIVRKKINLDVPLCADHKSQRTKNLWIGLLLLLGCIPAGIVLGGTVGGDAGMGAGILVGTAAFIAGVIFLGPGRAMLSPRFIDNTRATFRGAGEVFLNMIPEGAPHS